MPELTGKHILLAILALGILFLGCLLLQIPLSPRFSDRILAFPHEVDNQLEHPDIYLVSVNGTFENPQFTSDGKHVIYLASDHHQDPPQGGANDIWIMDSSGGDRRKITSSGTIGRVFVSPISDSIAYVNHTTWYSSGWVMADNYTTTVRLPDLAQNVYISSWSPDGRKLIVTASERRDDRSYYYFTKTVPYNPAGDNLPYPEDRLYIINSDGSNPRLLAYVTPGLVSHVTETSWSPDGRFVAAPLYDPNGPVIGIIDTVSGNVTRLTSSNCTYPRWNPHGTPIAFLRNFDVWTIDPDGSNETRISDDGFVNAISWNPAGTKLAYSDSIMIGIVDPHGDNLLRISPKTWPGMVSWSTDSGQITYSPGRVYGYNLDIILPYSDGVKIFSKYVRIKAD